MGWAAKILRFIWQNKGWIVPVVAEAYNVVSKWIRNKNNDTPDSDVNNDTSDSDAQVNSNDDDNTTGGKHSGTANCEPDQNNVGDQDTISDEMEPRNEINTVIFPI